MRYREFAALSEYKNKNETLYTHEDMFTFQPCFLFEAGDSDIDAKSNKNWEINQSNAFGRGWKKHKKNSKIVASFEELVNFIISHDTIPNEKSYPPHLKSHRIHANNRSHSPNLFQAHLSGTKIILQFEVIPAPEQSSKNKLNLVHIGTHREVGQK